MFVRLRDTARGILGALPASVAVRLHYAAHHGRLPHVRSPRRFSEKVIWRKLYDRDPRLPARADKIEVKSFVSSKLGPSWVMPALWSGPTLPPRSARKWPVPFVIKASNGSGTNIFVRKSSDCDWDAIESRCADLLSKPHGQWAGEWLYGQIPPRLLVEPYLGEGDIMPLDYKFYVFGGKIHCVEVVTGRGRDLRTTFFDSEWNRLEIAIRFPTDSQSIDRPNHLSDMIAAACTLAEDIPFVRVDLYEVRDTPMFGEMTFYPDSGTGRFFPDRHDFEFGALWNINR